MKERKKKKKKLSQKKQRHGKQFKTNFVRVCVGCVGLGVFFFSKKFFFFLVFFLLSFFKSLKSLKSFPSKLPKTPGGVFSFLLPRKLKTKN